MEIAAADIESLSSSLDAVLDGADGVSETGDVVGSVFVETDPTDADEDPLSDDFIV
ncbi:MAG: hypothetical protein QGG75_15460 [Alphaproteobacteria bacterium]|nr:hypothetical protein [Alphaproteobacteria bacterium]